MFQFTEQDLDKYRGVDPKWGPVGLVTYKRTYSRPIYQNGKIAKREEWLDTCVRVIEGNMNLVPGDPTATKEWAVKALDMMFHMAWLPPGRGLWMLGTEYAKMRGGDALNNCWFIDIKPGSYEDISMFRGTYVHSSPTEPMPSFPFVFTADRAMLGGGVGFGISKDNISQFQPVSNKVTLRLIVDSLHKDWDRIMADPEYDELKGSLHMLASNDDERILLCDSREGWDTAIREVIDAHWKGESTTVCIDLSWVRGYGEEIKGFGGTSSGILPLISGLVSINRVLNNRYEKSIRSTDALDIMNLIGKIVVSGNVRRTALIAIGDATDEEYVNAKNYTLTNPILKLDTNGFPIWKTVDGKMSKVKKPYDECVKELGKEKTDELIELEWAQENHRWASNNSVFTSLDFIDFQEISAGIKANGEPGIVNKDLIKHFGRIKDGRQENIDADATGVNPCGEITLASAEPCNLVEVIPYICEREGYSIEEALKVATEYAYRITFAEYSWPQAQRIISKNHRIGVSLTGLADYCLDKYGRYTVEGFEDEDIVKPVFNAGMQQDLDNWYQIVKSTNEAHAKGLNSTPSIKLTTCKPSGTIAKLPGVSSGIHFHYSPYLIQRIRFHETDPNLDVLRVCGYPIEKDHQAPNTMVVEFPVKAANADNPNFKCSGDVSIEEQFANQYLFAHSWADNAVSATITFQEREHDKIEPLLRAYRDRIKSTSLLPYSGHGYVQAPWEPISKEEYEKRVAAVTVSLEEAYKATVIEDKETEVVEADCSSGACPIR